VHKKKSSLYKKDRHYQKKKSVNTIPF